MELFDYEINISQKQAVRDLLVVYLFMLIIFFRTLLLRILKLMVVYSFLSSLAVTRSVATGQNEYYPLYGSIGNVHNTVHRAHQDVLGLVGLLSIPKSKFLSLLLYIEHSCIKKWTENIVMIPISVNSAVDFFIHRYNDPWTPTIWYDNSWSLQMLWWAFSVYHLWFRTLYCWLSRTSVVGLYFLSVVDRKYSQSVG